MREYHEENKYVCTLSQRRHTHWQNNIISAFLICVSSLSLHVLRSIILFTKLQPFFPRVAIIAAAKLVAAVVSNHRHQQQRSGSMVVGCFLWWMDAKNKKNCSETRYILLYPSVCLYKSTSFTNYNSLFGRACIKMIMNSVTERDTRALCVCSSPLIIITSVVLLLMSHCHYYYP